MKTIILTLSILCSALTLAAQPRTEQTARQEAMDFLREEGYLPKLDEDGEIFFKIQGANYFVLLESQSDGSVYLNFMTLYGTDQPYEKILEGCNSMNEQKRVTKFIALKEEDGSTAYRITYESFCNPEDDFTQLLHDAIALLPECVSEFIDKYEE